MFERLHRYLHQAIVVLFHLLVITVPFVFTWVNEELFEFNKMLLTYALALGIGGLWIARMVVEKRLIFRRTILDIPIGLFVASQVLSTVFSIHPYTSIFGYYTRFHGGLLSTVTYVLLFYAFVSNISKKQLPAFMFSTLLASIGVSLYAIPEHFGYSPSCLLINQDHAFDVACWIQDVKSRVFGTFGQPNWLAAYCITVMLWAAGILGWSFKRLSLRVVAAISIAFLFVTLIYTQSRSGIIGLGLGGVVFAAGVVILAIRSWSSSKVNLAHSVYAWLGGLAVICGVFFIFSGDALVKTLATNLGVTTVSPESKSTEVTAIAPVNRLEVGITDSGDIRKIVWQGAFDIGKRYLLLGSGVETFAYSYYQDRPMAHNLVSEWDFLYNKAHNEFLNFWATTGLVGLVSYIVLLLAMVGMCGRLFFHRDTSENNRWLALGTGTSIVALSVSNFFGFSTVMVTILLFLLPAVVLVATSNPMPEESQPSSPITTSQWLLLGTFALIICYGWFMVYTWWLADYNYATGKQYFRAGYYSEGLSLLQTAAAQSPQEALYFDELSTSYAQLAAGLYQQGDSTTAAQLAEAALLTSNQTLSLNSRHLNFHKSRARVFINLATLDERYLVDAKGALEQAINLAPTDPKLLYNLALVEDALGEKDQARQHLETVITMKSNYDGARAELARLYQEAGNYQAAIEQYEYILENITPGNEVIEQRLVDVQAQLATQSAGTNH